MWASRHDRLERVPLSAVRRGHTSGRDALSIVAVLALCQSRRRPRGQPSQPAAACRRPLSPHGPDEARDVTATGFSAVASLTESVPTRWRPMCGEGREPGPWEGSPGWLPRRHPDPWPPWALPPASALHRDVWRRGSQGPTRDTSGLCPVCQAAHEVAVASADDVATDRADRREQPSRGGV